MSDKYEELIGESCLCRDGLCDECGVLISAIRSLIKERDEFNPKITAERERMDDLMEKLAQREREARQWMYHKPSCDRAIKFKDGAVEQAFFVECSCGLDAFLAKDPP